MRNLRSRLVVSCLLSSACGDARDDAPLVCHALTTRGLAAADRHVLGEAGAYPADDLRARDDELRRSQTARRELGWKILEKLVAPTTLAATSSEETRQVPLWRTFYDRDDIARAFQSAYAELGADGRRNRAAIDLDAARRALRETARAAETLPGWSVEEEQERLSKLEAVDVHGIGGHTRVAYGPSLATHLVSSYATVSSCAGGVDDEAIQSAGLPSLRRDRFSGAASTCSFTVIGPYVVSGKASVVSNASADVDLYLRWSEAPSLERFDVRSPADGDVTRAEIEGEGLLYIAVLGRGEGTFDLMIDRDEREDFGRCLSEEAPLDAVAIKADWRRAELGAALPVYDTSAARMRTRLADSEAWGDGEGASDPGTDDIYTIRTPTGGVFRLAALHVMTKELRHWVWTTYWWSRHPDDDFGADRSPALTGPWSNYKMCVATSYDEGDTNAPEGGGTLDAALSATRDRDAASWCSNPYLEKGEGNAATNCIGCHQHAGAKLTSEQIIADETRFPRRGRLQVRDNFPADYLWTLTAGEAIARTIADEVEQNDAFDR